MCAKSGKDHSRILDTARVRKVSEEKEAVVTLAVIQGVENGFWMNKDGKEKEKGS